MMVSPIQADRTPGSQASVLPTSTVCKALRCWCAARGNGDAVQSCLYRALDPYGWGMLAPVIDGLLTSCEACVGRPLRPGCGWTLSSDEQWLVQILTSITPRPAPCDAHGDDDLTSALGSALCSARIMIRMTLADAPAPH